MINKTLLFSSILACSALTQVGAFEVYTAWPFDSAEAARRQQQTAADLGLPAELSIDLGNGVTLVLELVPAGRSSLGSPASEPGHEGDETQRYVTFDTPFYMTKYQLTREQYYAVLNDCPWDYAGEPDPSIGGDRYPALVWYNAADSIVIPALNTKMPAGMVLRKPTRDEQEHACRAGTATTWYSGSDEAAMARIGWYRGNSGNAIHPVGLKGSNPWGLCDMVGNAWTWVYTQTPMIQVGEPSWLVMGGSYNSDAFGNGCRTANVMIQAHYVGLRLVASLPSGPVGLREQQGASPGRSADPAARAAMFSLKPRSGNTASAYTVLGRRIVPANHASLIPSIALPGAVSKQP
jgi:hypothetical protein